MKADVVGTWRAASENLRSENQKSKINNQKYEK